MSTFAAPARRLRTALALATITTCFAAGCSIGDIKSTGSAGGGTSCGTVKLANNNWVGYAANTAVVKAVLEEELGCIVEVKDLTEQISWQGFASGEVDAILEDWGHPDLEEMYVEEQGVATKAGKLGVTGQIGWWIPPWLATEHPELLTWQGLNAYAANFATSESGGQGQLLDGDPAFVTNDEAIVRNNGLNFKVVYSGSEPALVSSFQAAEKNKTWLIGYFYSPHWLLAELPLKQVALPEYTEGCDEDLELIACGYPVTDLTKFISTSFAESGSPAAKFIKAFSWSNEEQNTVAKAIQDGASLEEAGAAWVEDNPDRVAEWLGTNCPVP